MASVNHWQGSLSADPMPNVTANLVGRNWRNNGHERPE